MTQLASSISATRKMLGLLAFIKVKSLQITKAWSTKNRGDLVIPIPSHRVECTLIKVIEVLKTSQDFTFKFQR